MSDDRYREWDAAYVLGSLSPAERHEYEQHLEHCPECTAALAELAGMPGLLASIDPDEAFAIENASSADQTQTQTLSTTPPTMLPALLSRARASRRRSRLVAIGVGAGSVAAAVAITLVIMISPFTTGGEGNDAAGEPTAALASHIDFVPKVPGPLSAVATLNDEPWGTRIEWKCSYAESGTPPTAAPVAPPTQTASASTGTSAAEPWPSGGPSGGPGGGGPGDSVGYGLIVTDRAGNSVQVATWTSDPGSMATPTATTSIHLADIAQLSIVLSQSGEVLLTSAL